MYVQEIIDMKDHLEDLKNKGLIAAWELPHENLLTRLSAAIFFIAPVQEDSTEQIWETLKVYPNFNYRLNENKKLSSLAYRVTFNDETH